METERLRPALGGKGDENSKQGEKHQQRCGGGKDHGTLEGQRADHPTEGVGHKRQGCPGRYTSSKRETDIHRGEKVTISPMILPPRDNYLAVLPSKFFPMQKFPFIFKTYDVIDILL